MTTTQSPVLLDGWRMSVGTLTAIPIRPPSRIDRAVAARAMLLAPLATLPITAVWLLCGVGAAVVPLPWLWAALAVTGTTLSTRAMHLDGLADTADGLSASYDRDRALAVMKTGDVGPSGAAAIALTLMLQAAASAALFSVPAPRTLALGAVAVAASRLSLAIACRRGVPSARPGGLGATVAGSVSIRALAASAAVLVGIGGVAVGLLHAWPHAGGAGAVGPSSPVVLGAVASLGIVGAVALATAMLVRRCTRRLGGITGDVLGAAVEITCAVALTVAAVAGYAVN